MAYVEVDNPGLFGIIPDIASHRLPNEALTAGQNIRMQEGAVYKFFGHDAVFDPPAVAPRWLLQAFKEGEIFWIYTSLTAAHVTDGSVHKDITNAGGPFAAIDSIKWTGGNFSGVPVLNNGVDVPQYWDRNFATPGPLQDIPNWPAATTARILRPFKNFLVVADVVESGTRFEDVVRWSHPASPGGLPTSWDSTDPTKDAGRVSVAEDAPGPVRDMLLLGGSFFIYKETGTFRADHIGGRFVLGFRPVFPALGVLATDCVQSFDEGRKHLLLTAELELVAHDGVSTAVITEKKWSNFLRENISEDNFGKCFIVPHYGRREMWVCFPSVNSTLPDTALVWNTKDNSFGIRDLPEGAYAKFGLVETGADDTIIDTGIYSEMIIDDVDALIDQRSFGSLAGRILIAGTSDTKLYRADNTNQFASNNMLAYAERKGLGIAGVNRDGSPKVDFTTRKILQSLYPKIDGGPVSIYALVQEKHDGPITYFGPEVFDPLTDIRVDFGVSGRFLGYRVESTGDVAWRFDGMGFEVEPLGKF